MFVNVHQRCTPQPICWLCAYTRHLLFWDYFPWIVSPREKHSKLRWQFNKNFSFSFPDLAAPGEMCHNVGLLDLPSIGSPLLNVITIQKVWFSNFDLWSPTNFTPLTRHHTVLLENHCQTYCNLFFREDWINADFMRYIPNCCQNIVMSYSWAQDKRQIWTQHASKSTMLTKCFNFWVICSWTERRQTKIAWVLYTILTSTLRIIKHHKIQGLICTCWALETSTKRCSIFFSFVAEKRK